MENPLRKLIAEGARMQGLSDPVVRRLVELHKSLEDAAREGSMIRGWRPLLLDSKGWVIADRIAGGMRETNEFEPVGEWKKAADYLTLEGEFRSLLFSELTSHQIDSYRAGVGLTPKSSREKNDTDKQ
jgi:hypothetical protein